MDENLLYKDQIYAASVPPGDFVFDEKVANVFEDMINRSVPGYETIISMIGVLASRYYQGGSFIYDLGCSLGGATFSICENLQNTNFSLIAIDNSSAMIERLEAKKVWLVREISEYRNTMRKYSGRLDRKCFRCGFKFHDSVSSRKYSNESYQEHLFWYEARWCVNSL
jgi:hypothetical protein